MLAERYVSAENLTTYARTFDAVSVLTQSNDPLVLIGEHHESPASAALVRQVLDSTTPALIAIESSPSQQSLFADGEPNISAGADVAVDYARQQGAQIGLIDRPQLDILMDITSLPLEPSPCSPPSPKANGDIPMDAVAEYRNRVKHECPRRYARMLVDRERHMAGLVRTLDSTIDGPIVVVVGAAHFPALVEHLEDDSIPARDVSDDRIQSVK